MRILIVEDEPASARMLKRILSEQLGARIQSIRIAHTLTGSSCDVEDHEIDLLFLDLDVNGEDGFDVLRQVVSKQSFHTIVVSANTQRALEAFQYGVVDFIPKPVDPDRMAVALARLQDRMTLRSPLDYLPVQAEGTVQLIPLARIAYFEADLKRSIMTLTNGEKRECTRSLRQLSGILPPTFVRVHKSFIVRKDLVWEVRRSKEKHGELVLKSEEGEMILPVSRRFLSVLKGVSGGNDRNAR